MQTNWTHNIPVEIGPLLERLRRCDGTQFDSTVIVWEQCQLLVAEYEKLLAAIRKHRDERGDDRCWKDNETLYAVLPEGYTPPERDSLVELENCKRYIASCHDPRTRYESPQRRIEELEAQVEELQETVMSYRR